jgi:hypothetical protein
MGKPFENELGQIERILKWAFTIELPIKDDELAPLFRSQALFVGSGGSLSACHLGAMLHQRYGFAGKAMTPLELIHSKDIISNSNIFLLSANGRNVDIIKACEIAKIYGAQNLVSIVMSKNSPLAKKVSEYEYSNVLEFQIPTGKDGFLATNSLIAYFIFLLRLYKEKAEQKIFSEDTLQIETFVQKLPIDFTLVVLYSGWGAPIAYDIESKFAEAGLGNILLTDYRNFAHGRHNWFDKKRTQSAIVELVTPTVAQLSDKTINLLPMSIPRLKLETATDDPIGAVELLMKSFQLVLQVGKKVGIDPGRPTVPDYGSKIYRLTYPKGLIPNKKDVMEELWLRHKTGIADLSMFNDSERKIVRDYLAIFRNKIISQKFGGIIFDYDGTL